MTVHVNGFYVEGNELKHNQKKGVVAERRVGDKIKAFQIADEEYAKKFSTIDSNISEVTLMERLTILNKLKELVNKEVSRRDNYYHVFLYNENTLEVDHVELPNIVSAHETIPNLVKEVKRLLASGDKELNKLVENGYKFAFITNMKLDWYFDGTDYQNVFEFHSKYSDN